MMFNRRVTLAASLALVLAAAPPVAIAGRSPYRHPPR
jgi:hypothetical protein